MPESAITNLDDPQAIAEKYGASYADLKADSESRVTLWRWASQVMYDPRPFGAILAGGPGRWLRQKKKGIMPYEYGFGQPGQILVERIYQGQEYRGQFSSRETFFFHGPERVVSLTYPHISKHLDWVCVTRFGDRRPVSHSRNSPYAVVGRLEEQYHYRDGLVRRRECREVRCGIPVQYAHDFIYGSSGFRVGNFRPSGR
jgi:hypothetical protein